MVWTEYYRYGITNNGNSNGTLKIEVPQDAPNELYYQCSIMKMNGILKIMKMVTLGQTLLLIMKIMKIHQNKKIIVSDVSINEDNKNNDS